MSLMSWWKLKVITTRLPEFHSRVLHGDSIIALNTKRVPTNSLFRINTFTSHFESQRRSEAVNEQGSASGTSVLAFTLRKRKGVMQRISSSRQQSKIMAASRARHLAMQREKIRKRRCQVINTSDNAPSGSEARPNILPSLRMYPIILMASNAR